MIFIYLHKFLIFGNSCFGQVTHKPNIYYGESETVIHIKGKSSAPTTWNSDWSGTFYGTIEWNCPH